MRKPPSALRQLSLDYRTRAVRVLGNAVGRPAERV